MAPVRVTPIVLALAAGLALSACDTGLFSGEDDDELLPGTRISVLALERELRPDLEAIDTAIRLPKPEDAPNWPQTGGLSHHAMHHMLLGDAPEPIWSESIGEGTGKRNRVLAEPVIAEDRVFTMDS
ncbi:MAG: pyrrolo-quinoline quinone, partial [Alphaproteobacteria bacterium]|nr:pyrrolo-quinoline quinone [Alphaproteobacteria bacterium]